MKEVEVWLGSTEAFAESSVFDAWMERFPKWRLEKLKKLKSEEEKLRSMAAGALFTVALSSRGLDAKAEEIGFSEEGKPFLVAHPELFFNLSHAGATVVCALSDRPIGIDVERIGAVSESIAKKFFTEAEKRELAGTPLSERDVLLCRRWTQKEAYVKAIGKGGSIPFSIVEADEKSGSIAQIGKGTESKLSFESFAIGKDSICTLCGKFDLEAGSPRTMDVDFSAPIFRLAVNSDLKEICKLCGSVIGSEFCTWNAFYPTEEDFSNDIREKRLFVLEEAGRLVAAGSIVPENELDSLDCWKFCNAHEYARVMVAKEKQNQGYAKRLLKALLLQSKAEGKTAVHLLAATKNTPACKLYQSLGFEVRGECDMYSNHYKEMEIEFS